MDAHDAQNERKRNASNGQDDGPLGSEATSASDDRDDLARLRERRSNRPALTRREREERWPIG